jgi:hypothetical protein
MRAQRTGLPGRDNQCTGRDFVLRLTSYISRLAPSAVYLQPAQDEAEQPPQPEPDEEDAASTDPLPIPNFDSRLVVSFELQEGQTTSGLDP